VIGVELEGREVQLVHPVLAWEMALAVHW
jgi:hypothetical protein